MTDEVLQICFLGNNVVSPFSRIEIDFLSVILDRKGKFRNLGSLK